LDAHAPDLRPRVLGGATSASAGMFHSQYSFQAILMVQKGLTFGFVRLR